MAYDAQNVIHESLRRICQQEIASRMTGHSLQGVVGERVVIDLRFRLEDAHDDSTSKVSSNPRAMQTAIKSHM